ncbi:unnamed protein product [Durusdinium trenchii]|uniref:Uncharacterized protein n=1 Tax=Durusdinium trenchii TaxID=1381693 RepID=A0ABP0QLG7_9DINO
MCGGYILEVAGGKGALATALGTRGMKVLMVDPRPPDVSDKPDELESEAVEGEDVHPVGSVDRICEHFDDSSMELVFGAEVVVAMHPDEATDAIVDAALTAQRPFAVVPCCVFPRLFHHRRLHNGGGVVGYTGLLRFLREKDPRIRAARLPFAGRNVVLYMTKGDFAAQKQDDVGPLHAPNWVRPD